METSHPGNIGSAARAMMTMGLSDLVLVNPKEKNVTEHPHALALASGATEVLANARIVATLAEAIADVHFAVGFTARRRELSHPIVSLREAIGIALNEAGWDHKIALVFGNEAMCLSNADVAQCQLAATIPANPAYASLNVAQSIQVAAYEVMMQSGAADAAFKVTDHTGRAQASVGEIEHFLRHLQTTAIDSGFLDPTSPKRFMTRMQRLFTRAKMEPEEVAILRGLLASFQESKRN